MTGFREFQRQSLQQLRQNPFDQDDYENFDVAVKIFESMELPNDTKFYWACINESILLIEMKVLSKRRYNFYKH